MLVLLCSVCALTKNSLGSVEAVVGAVCIVLSSLLLPTMFYFGSLCKIARIKPQWWLLGGLMMSFGAALMVLIIGQTIGSMLS